MGIDINPKDINFFGSRWGEEQLDALLEALISRSNALPDGAVGQANGLATLGSDGKLPEAQMPTRLSDSSLNARFARGPLTPLYGWLSQLSSANTQQANVLMMGDSIMEGFGAPNVASRWVDLAQAKLRKEFNASGVAGGEWVPAMYFVGPQGTDRFAAWTYAGTTTDSSYGPGFKAKQIYAGTTATITRYCSSIDLWFRLVAAGQQVTIAIDGGAPVTLTIDAVAKKWSSGALAPGNHTVVVTRQVGSPALVGGYFYNGDETTGVRLIDGSHSGATAGLFATANDWRNWLTPLGIDLIVIGVITNDSRASSNGYSAATYKGHIESIISQARAAKANVPILLLPTFQPTGETIEPWSNYINALAQVAAATPYTALYDTSLAIPSLVGDPFGILMDGVHPSTAGHALMRDLSLLAMSHR